MIIYKNDFSHPPSSYENFPSNNDCSLINWLPTTWAKKNAGDIWKSIGGLLVQYYSSDNSYIVANAGDQNIKVSFDYIADPEVGTSTDWSFTVALGSNATATIGLGCTFTKSSIYISNLATGYLLASKTFDAIDIVDGETHTLKVVAFKNGGSAYLSVYDSETDTSYMISTERAKSPVTFSTYVGLRGTDDRGSTEVPVGTFDNLQVESIFPRVEVTADMMTLADLRASVTEEVFDTSITTAQIDLYLNSAYKEIYLAEHWRERKLTSDIVLHSGVSDYLLPTNMSEIASLRRIGSVLRYDGEKSIELLYSGLSPASTPDNVVFSGRTMRILGTPGDAWDNTILVCEYFAPITKILTTGFIDAGLLVTSTDYPNLHPVLHQCVALKAAILLSAKLREDGIAPATMTNRFVKMYRDAKDIAFGRDQFPAQIRVQRR